MFESKTVTLYGGREVELPSPAFALTYNGGANSHDILISELTEAMNSVMFPLDDAMLSERECQEIIEAVLWDESYPFDVKYTLATRYYKNEQATIEWVYNYGKGPDLYNIVVAHPLNSYTISCASGNKNYTPEILQQMFDYISPSVVKEFLKNLIEEAFTENVMVWLLETAGLYQTEEVVQSRITKILGLPSETPATWVLKVVKSLPQDSVEEREAQNA